MYTYISIYIHIIARSLILNTTNLIYKIVVKLLLCYFQNINKIFNSDLTFINIKKQCLSFIFVIYHAKLTEEVCMKALSWIKVRKLYHNRQYVNVFNQFQETKNIYYHKKGERNVQTLFQVSKEIFCKGFAISVGFPYNGEKKE